MTEREAKQMPICFVSRALRADSGASHANCTNGKRGAYCLFGNSQRNGKCGPDDRKRSKTNAHLLRQQGIKRPRVSVKGKILVELIVERPEEDSLDTLIEVEEELPKPWILFTDGPSCTDGTLQENYVMREIGEGSYSMHAGTRSVVAKALRIGYYWPTMHKDTRLLLRACQDYQVHKPVPRNPEQKLTPITSLWPFYKWGIDIAGPFLEEPRKVKFLIVAIDNFTKWIEAKRVATITGKKANSSLRERIKSRLDAKSKNWMEELPHVLWAHRTMIKSSNEDTPFSLTHRTEAVIPVEIGMRTLRIMKVDLVQNDEALGVNLHLF
nr:hypothetical protein [Tanacetum cinerariifolium]